MRAESVWLIYNPASGAGRGPWMAGFAAEKIRLEGWSVEVRPTEGQRHARELVREAVAACASRIGIISGDGSIHDAIVGLDGSPIPLALLPAGTGNDLARSLGVPRSPAAAVDTLLHGKTRKADLWLWNGVPFVNVAAVGLDLAVAAAVNLRLRRLRGTLAYLAGVVLTLPCFRPLPANLTGDDWSYQGEMMLVAVANGQYYGGGMRIAPAARLDDGLLDVILVEKVSRLELARQMPRLFRGTHLSHPRVRSWTTRRLAIEVAREHPVSLDGELEGGLPATVERASQPVYFMAPG